MAEANKIYDFNSVGTTAKKESDAYSQSNENFPIGIATPVRQSQGSDSLFLMNKDLLSQIRDNFRNMLSTNHGERLMLGDFGANLKPLAYELGSDSGDAEAIARISKTTSKYMPFIALGTFETIKSPSPDETLTKIGVRVSYTVPQISQNLQQVEVVILSAG